MKVIDIHSHLQFPEFDNSRDDIINQLTMSDIGTIVVGTNAETSQQAVDLAIQHENIWATIGHHPTENLEISMPIYRHILDSNKRELYPSDDNGRKIVAIGECGLDYYRSPKEEVYDQQLKNFQAQIDLAIEFQLPLVLHGRPSAGSMDAYDDMLDILTTYHPQLPTNPGNAHFFVGDIDVARRFLDLGFTISFDGPITFARDYDEVIKYIPGDMIHAETDAPYAAPLPYRGQQNSPLYINHVIDSLIEIRGEDDPDGFRQQLVENAKRVFKLNPKS